MEIKKIELSVIRLPLKEAFEISVHKFTHKSALILKVETRDGLIGWSEGEHLEAPWYVPETIQTGWNILSTFFIPQILGYEFSSVHQVMKSFSWMQGNQLSRSAVDVLFHDLFSKQKGLTLSEYIGGRNGYVPAGKSIGIMDTPGNLVDEVSKFVDIGYKRIKIKIKPGKDIQYIEAVRSSFPKIPLMADANTAYSLDDITLLKQLDPFNLMMIEQPLGNGDLVNHAILATKIKTPICLDESIHSMNDAASAHALKACSIINIKPPRIGGLSAVVEMQSYLQSKGIPVWCGGMLEAGIGRAVNLACASLPGFTIPGDTAPPLDYLREDITNNDFLLTSDGMIEIPTGLGIGVDINETILDKYTVKRETFNA